LKLKTRSGDINIEVWILGDGKEVKTEVKRATVDVSSNDGSINVRMRSLAEMPNQSPFHLSARTRHGSIQIHVPRSFHGPITIATRDSSVQFSDELPPFLATLGETLDERVMTRRCFVGPLPQSDSSAWAGDEVEVFTRDGSVRILYEDEVGMKGFFRRMLEREMTSKVLGKLRKPTS